MPLVVVLLVVVVGGAIVLLTRDDAGADDPRRQAYVDAIAGNLERSTPEADEAALRCTAEATVDALGVDRLAAEGTPDYIRNSPDNWEPMSELTEGEASRIVDGWFACLDYREVLQQEMVSRGQDAAIAGCLLSRITDDQLKDLLVAQLLGDPQVTSDFGELVRPYESECRA